MISLEDKLRQTFNVPYSMKVRVFGSKRPKLTIVFIHGIGLDGEMWNRYVEKISKKSKVRVVVVDLIGFGGSNKSEWQTFDLETQAKSLHATLISNLIFIGKNDPLLIIGHSLGSLVAIKFTSLYPHLVDYQMLISPPIYKTKAKKKNVQEQALLKFYDLIIKNPLALEGTRLAVNNFLKYDYQDNDRYREIFISTLKNAIINQDSYDEILRLRIPSLIYYGAFDPLIVEANLTEIDDKSPFVWSHKIIGTHDANRLMFNKISCEINNLIEFYVK